MAREQLILVAETALSEQQAKPQESVKITPKMIRIVDALDDISQNQPTDKDKAYTTRYLVQATLPHRAPKGTPPFWSRENGNYTLTIQPGVRKNKETGKREIIGYPSGTIPRLILYWMTTEVVRTRNRKLFLGESLSEFMYTLGLNPRNGGLGSKRSDRKRLHTQAERLFRARISFDYTSDDYDSWLDMQVAPKGELWWDLKNPGQLSFFESWIELGEEFYKALIDGCFPVDMRALRVLKDSALDLDLYAWVHYKTYQVNRRKRPQRVPYVALGRQLGANYSRPRDLSRYIKDSLKRVIAVSPGIRLDEESDVVIVRPGITAIQERRTP